MKKKEYDEVKEEIKILLIILLTPIVFLIIDVVNWGHFLFPYIDNLTEKYDWLSFMGAYAGAIASAILLLIITKIDRRANNEELRKAQRPYLEVSWAVVDKEILNKNIERFDRNIFAYNFGLDAVNNADNYLVLEIKNTGASVAILEVNKSSFTYKLEHFQKINEGKNVCKKETSRNVELNKIVKRKSIASGDSMFVLFNSWEFYNHETGELSSAVFITNTEIYYKDLFNYNYEDICKYKDGMIVPEKDNSIVIENNTDEE